MSAYRVRLAGSLTEVVHTARAGGAEVVLVTVPVRAKLSPTWKHPQPLGGGPGDAQVWTETLARVVAVLAAGDAATARKEADLAVDRWPLSPMPRHLRGMVLEASGDLQNALVDYQLARDHMVGNLGGLPSFNNEVRNVARQTGAWLVDAEAIFAEDSLAAGRLDLYMDDDCHPNPAGHRRLAEALVAVLQGVNLHDD
jgi:hypothetical protein